MKRRSMTVRLIRQRCRCQWCLIAAAIWIAAWPAVPHSVHAPEKRLEMSAYLPPHLPDRPEPAHRDGPVRILTVNIASATGIDGFTIVLPSKLGGKG